MPKGEWQPIATAPRERVNGILQSVLLIGFYPNIREPTEIVQGWFSHGKWMRWRHEFEPSHWMYPPAPPVGEREAEYV